MIRRFLAIAAVGLFAGCTSVTPTSNGAAPQSVAGSNAPVRVDRYDHPIRLACVGDSITFGYTLKHPATQSYPAQLQRMLGAAHWEVRNFGVSATTLLNSGDRPYTKTKAYHDALAFNPDVVVIMLGTNDSKPQNWAHRARFEGDYEQLIRAFEALPAHPRVFVCHPILVADGGKWGINEPVVLEEDPLVDAAARATGAGVIDMQPVMRGHEALMPDNVHPNAEGARLMARAVYTALTGHPFSGQ